MMIYNSNIDKRQTISFFSNNHNFFFTTSTCDVSLNTFVSETDEKRLKQTLNYHRVRNRICLNNQKITRRRSFFSIQEVDFSPGSFSFVDYFLCKYLWVINSWLHFTLSDFSRWTQFRSITENATMWSSSHKLSALIFHVEQACKRVLRNIRKRVKIVKIYSWTPLPLSRLMPRVVS